MSASRSAFIWDINCSMRMTSSANSSSLHLPGNARIRSMESSWSCSTRNYDESSQLPAKSSPIAFIHNSIRQEGNTGDQAIHPIRKICIFTIPDQPLHKQLPKRLIIQLKNNQDHKITCSYCLFHLKRQLTRSFTLKEGAITLRQFTQTY